MLTELGVASAPGRRLDGSEALYALAVYNEPRPRILFQSVPEGLASAFDDLPGTHTCFDGVSEVHASDHDLLVTFESSPELDPSWHVLGFGLGRIGINSGYLKRRSPDNFARAAYVADNAVANDLGRLVQRTILEGLPEVPRATWAAMEWSDYGADAYPVSVDGDLGGRAMPLVHLGQEKTVYALVTERPSGQLAWALPPETSGHRDWLLHVLQVLHKTDPSRFPGEPDWQAGTMWATPDLARAHKVKQDRIAERDRMVATADQEVALAEEEIQTSRNAASSGAWRMLTEDGDELVHAVQDALTMLGFDVEELDEEHHTKHGRRLEDLRATDPVVTDWESLVEVKGYAKGAKANDVHQVTQAPTTYFAIAHGRPPRTVWHVVNVQRGVDPSNRATALPSDADLQALTDAPGALIDTRDLFRAWRDVMTTTARAEDVRESLRNARTRWTWPSASGEASPRVQ